MSVTIRLRVLRLAALALAATVAGGTLAARAPSAPELPPAVAALVPEARAIGGGELRFLGLAIYDGFYWAPRAAFSPIAPFALDLHYRRDLAGRSIAERSTEEIEKLGHGTADERRRWGEAMRQIFPDVRTGDRLTGVNVPGEGVRFFYNGAPIGRIDDSAFAHAFFAIWLDSATSRPDFRRRLLGGR
jgi:hypothetical protein